METWRREVVTTLTQSAYFGSGREAEYQRHLQTRYPGSITLCLCKQQFKAKSVCSECNKDAIRSITFFYSTVWLSPNSQIPSCKTQWMLSQQTADAPTTEVPKFHPHPLLQSFSCLAMFRFVMRKTFFFVCLAALSLV